MQAESSSFPWRPLAALLLALAAQTLLEPPANEFIALAWYLLAGAFVLWSYRRGEWTLPESQSPITSYQPPRILPLLASLPLLGAAFYFLGGNRFTWLNLTLWIAGIIFFLRSVWSKNENPNMNDTDPLAEKHGFFFLL